ncbi:DUF2845 domain-containing protein [Ferrimonas balearica]|uniref:DUF2845 domain-containing protein n=1 Tax=Ferrimonas balearica TaxID=44012 RepID=UPI001F1EF130|nr:DUF2845 domain-containing protein [Ferrimonas balearica]MBY6019105.1 DUF2845 domain-containing protein [Halomonas denitrificans]MBY6095709.1 DUF2845 domain-containing protein [Ferrimonas balearica]
MSKCLLLLLLMLLTFPTAGYQKTLPSVRCGTHLIRVGDSLSALKRACGKPLSIDSAGKKGKDYSYQFGRSGAITLIRVKQHRVTRILMVR